MIHLEVAPEPAWFKEKVREPGENALALLAGRPTPHKRLGRPILPTKMVNGVQVPKTIADFDYWADCLEELHDVYRGICAYYCFRVEKASHPHTDHFVAKSDVCDDQAYEWKNYRLACGHANSCKQAHPDVLDPAKIEDGWFQLDVLTEGVRADVGLDDEVRKMVDHTILRLELDKGRALAVRKHAMSHFRAGRVQLEFLAMDHPFLAKELLRQGIRTREQLPELPPQVLDAVEPELSVDD